MRHVVDYAVRVRFRDYLKITGTGLRDWLVVQAQDALAVGILWLAGLWLIGVPWAPLWAVMGALLQFIPNIGTILGLAGPAAAAAITGGFDRFVHVLILYAVIVSTDGFVLQPLLMKRAARVPVWASILAPLVLGAMLGFWGVLLAAPLLAIIYTYRAARTARGREPIDPARGDGSLTPPE
jgi:predicted PurR-regulated permease PerM